MEDDFEFKQLSNKGCIKNLIKFLELDIKYHTERGSVQRLDIHRWMIRYLTIKLTKK